MAQYVKALMCLVLANSIAAAGQQPAPSGTKNDHSALAVQTEGKPITLKTTGKVTQIGPDRSHLKIDTSQQSSKPTEIKLESDWEVETDGKLEASESSTGWVFSVVPLSSSEMGARPTGVHPMQTAYCHLEGNSHNSYCALPYCNNQPRKSCRHVVSPGNNYCACL
jgi:hypothetical protein